MADMKKIFILIRKSTLFSSPGDLVFYLWRSYFKSKIKTSQYNLEKKFFTKAIILEIWSHPERDILVSIFNHPIGEKN